ncbi:MAG: helix-turn-helix domain-containing protein [Pseudomonadota bacterium]|nr:helix-turn-helix domain-containing protein [Pseudomonadota bacterium]
MPAPVAIALTDEEREEFRRRCRSGKTQARLKERLSIVLLADEGLSNNEIAERLVRQFKLAEAVFVNVVVCATAIPAL